MWEKIIYRDKNTSDQVTLSRVTNFEKILTETIATSLIKDISHLFNSPPLNKILKNKSEIFSKSNKKFWLDYVSAIPDKLKNLDLFIRPYKDFCRTCIITEAEIEALVRSDIDRDVSNFKAGSRKVKTDEITDPNLFYHELNMLIPVQLKKAGYEIIRSEEVVEIDPQMILKLARALHAKYMHDTRTQLDDNSVNHVDAIAGYKENNNDKHSTDFDSLPPDTKISNLDNAAHIPTKLLSIGYRIRPAKKGYRQVSLSLSEDEVETMSRVEHLRWCWERRLNGWRYGQIRDTARKTHPSLINYNDLEETEKDRDRELVKLIPAFLKDIGFEIYHISPARIKNLSYALKPQSSIHRLLCESRRLSDEIGLLAMSSPEIKERINSINNKIEETLKEVQGSYNYASHIQEVFLPEDIYIRECFPESFVLFNPKNIVSGDFYFFSRKDDIIIFALADCTGHGIPGALISTIGYGYLDQVVNVKKITNPTTILRHLYHSLHRFMRRNAEGSGLGDDMDITLCQINYRTNQLTYSGVGNMVFLCSNNRIRELRLGMFKDESNLNQEYHFSSKKTSLKAGDILYICSDGFADQFGGKNRKKYQSKRLMDFLLKIHEYPMPEQNDLLYEEIERWREESDEEQTDDITVIGIRL
jgi:serine phosphatase RsbU (regulator of sigma subunit)